MFDSLTGSRALPRFGSRLLLVLALLLPGAALAGVDWVVNNNDTGYDPVPAGSDITYTITVANNGTTAAAATDLTLAIPATTTFIGASGMSCSGSGPVTCTVPPLAAAGGSATVLATIRSSVQGTVTLTASVPTAGDDDINNNSAAQATTVNAGADIALSLSGPASTQSGDTVAYTFTALNNGPDSAAGLTLSFPLPAGLANVTPPGGCTLAGSTYTCAIAGPLASGAALTRLFSGQVSAASPSTLTLAGSIATTTPLDPDTSNNTATFNTTVTPGSDLRITKSRSPSGSLLVGDAVTFTLTPSYTGDSPSNITVSDTLPANYSVGAVAPAQNGWSCAVAGQSVTCTRAAGSGAGNNVALGTIVIPASAASAGNGVTNSASISSSGGPSDPDPANNSGSDGGVTILEPSVDLRANKSGPVPPLVVSGAPFDYTLSATNSGTATFYGTLIMSDALPAGITLDGYLLNGWSCAPAAPVAGPATISCQRAYTSGAPLAADATTPAVTLNVTATTTGSLVNTMVVSSPDANIADTNPANDSATYTVTSSLPGSSADLSITKGAAPASVAAGDPLTYTIEIINGGPQTATSVTLSDSLTGLINSAAGASGAGYIGESISAGAASGGSCTTSASGATGRDLSCSFAAIPVCTQGMDCPVVTLQVRPGGNGGSRSNTASAVSSDVADPDSADRTATATSTVTPRADVTVTKSATPATVPAGQNLTYVVTAINVNNGLSQAADVTISDTLPPDVTFLSATPSSGSCATTPVANSTTAIGNDQLVCNLGTINNGAQQTVTIAVRPNTGTRGTALTNSVSVATTTAETDGGNNSASAVSSVGDPQLDLLINKTDSVDPVAAGDTTVYTVTVTNQGPSAAENVVISDTLPATRLTYQSHTLPAGGSCPAAPAVDSTGGTLTCQIPYLPAGQSRSFTLTLLGVIKGVDSNSASVGSDEALAGFDSNGANNSVTEGTTVRTKADPELVSKLPSAATVNLRDDFTFVIRVRNNAAAGLTEADNVVVSDTLPAGMELTATPTAAIVSGTASSTTCSGSAGGTSFSCNLGTLSSAGEVEITVPVQVTAVTAPAQLFTNSASVATSSLDVDGTNDNNSGSVTVNSSSLAGQLFRDFNNDGLVTAGADSGIGGITMTLTGTSFDGAAITRTATTDASGGYTFDYLPAGSYTISKGSVAESHLSEGIRTAGSAGGDTSAAALISAIPLPADTAASGYDFAVVPQARVGIAKQLLAGPDTNADGSFDVSFRLVVVNFSLEALDAVTVTDLLSGAVPRFGVHNGGTLAEGEYQVTAAPSGSCPGLQPGFSGTGANTTVALLPTLAAGASCTIDFTLRAQPVSPVPPGGYLNQAEVDAVGALSGQSSASNPQLHDLSHNGGNPDPDGDGLANEAGENSPTPTHVGSQAIGAAKAVTGIVQSGPRRYRIPYTLVVRNLSTTAAATNVQITDDLTAAFPDAVSRAIVTPAAVSACSGTLLRVAEPPFTGTGQNRLLAGDQHLQPGEECTITFTVEVEFGGGVLPTAPQNNQATATTHLAPGGAVVASDLSDDGANPDPNGNGNGGDSGEDDPTPVSFATGGLAAVSGVVYLDANHNRSNDDPLVSERVQGFIVEVLNSLGTVVATAVTGADGSYAIAGLFPSTAGDAATYYGVRFREPASGAIYGIPQSADPTPARNGTVSNGVITGLQLQAGATTLGQNLPLDPSGIVYDSVTRAHLAGAQVTLLSGGAAVPDLCLVGGINTQTTGASGQYQFLLINPVPPGCPGNATYTLEVVQPGGYLPPASTLIPPSAGPYVPSTGGVDAIQAQAGPPTGSAPTTYYLDFTLTVGASSDVVNNHIPLDPILGGAIALSKSTPLVNVGMGQLVPYTITAANTLAASLSNIDIRDTMPPGFKYKSNSATLDGVAAEPSIDGRVLTWSNLTLAPNATRTLKLLLIVGAGVQPGEYTNTAQAFNNLVPPPTDNAVSNLASAVVRVTPDTTFDCAELIGKVFDDVNANGYQDQGEPGIANVRLATARGWRVTTDAEGRFHVACPVIPDADHGSNFVMKLDERTLPTGYRVTTENPRDVRLTRGKMSKLAFGATIHKVVRIDMSDDAFEPGTQTLKPEWQQQLDAMPQRLAARPSVLRLGYKAGGEGEALARQRLAAIGQSMKERWQRQHCCHTLLIEEELFIPSPAANQEDE